MSERTNRTVRRADEETGEAMRQIQESGELRHLYGKQLELDDDPDWLVTRTLKQQGFSHPVLEHAKELEGPEEQAEQVLTRLRRRRAWLENPRSRRTTHDVRAFNETRERSLARYREKLMALNRAIRDYNLSAPTSLHRRPVSVEDAVARASAEIRPLEAAAPKFAVQDTGKISFRRRRLKS